MLDCISTIKYYKLISKSFSNKLLLLYPQLLLQLLLVLSFLLHQLLLQVRVAQHVVLAETVHFVVRVIQHLETLVHHCLLCLDLLWHLLVHQLFDLLLPALNDVGLLEFVLQLVVQPKVHQVAVHVLLQHLGVDQVLTAQLSHFLLAHELVFVVYHLAVLFLQFFGDVVDVRNPLWSWPELRDEIAANLGVLKSSKDQPTGVDCGKHVDAVVWLNAGEEFALSISDFDLFFVAEEDVLVAVIHEVDGVDGLVVRGTDGEELSVESDIVQVQH